MAKPRKQKGFKDPLDSVFGVIFGNAKSKPIKVKPTKLSGANASQELARGLAEIAASPANYVTGGFNALVGEYPNQINLVEFNYDKFNDQLRGGDNSAGRFRVRAGDVPSFLTNPNKFIDSVFEKAKQERSMAKWLHLGRGMDSALMATWAKQNGFSNKDSITIGLAAGNWLGVDQKNEARKKFAENIVLSSIGGKIDADKNFMPPDMARAVHNALDNAKYHDFIRKPGELEQVLKTVPGLSSRPDFNQIVSDIKDSYKKQSTRVYGIGKDIDRGGSSWITEGGINREGYISILQENMGYKAKLLSGTSDPKEMAERNRLLKAQGALEALRRVKGPGYGGNGLDQVQADAAEMINGLKKDLKANSGDPAKSTIIKGYIDQLTKQYNEAAEREQKLRRFTNPFRTSLNGNFSKYKSLLLSSVDYELQREKWDLASTTDAAKRAEILGRITFFENKKKGLKTMTGMEWRLLLGDLQGAIGGLQASRELPANILSGKFWNKNAQGNLAPSDGARIQILDQIIDRKGTKGVWSPDIFIPRQDISAGYASLTGMYYLTPGSLARTFLYNGEGFAYLKYLERANLANHLNKTGFTTQLLGELQGVMASDEKFAKEMKNFISDGKIDLNAFSLNYKSFMNSLDAKKGNLTGTWGKLESMMKRDQNSMLTRLTAVFGSGNRVLQRINAVYSDTIKDRVNKYLVENVVRKWLGHEVADQLIAVGLKNIGVKQLMTMAVSEWAAGIGAAVGGPIGAVLGAVVTYLATSFLESIIKPFIKIFFAFLWAFLVVLIAFIAWIVLLLFPGSYPGPQQHIPPTDNFECVGGNPFAGLYNFQPATDPGNLPNAPADSTCPILGDTLPCTQGSGPGASQYHQTYHGVDIGNVGDAIWYAPTDGQVISHSAVNICQSTGKDYGGVTLFRDSMGTVYRITHARILASGSVSKGTPIAIMQFDLVNDGSCWTGPHFHLDVQAGGAWVDAQKWYEEKLKCNIVPSGNGAAYGCAP